MVLVSFWHYPDPDQRFLKRIRIRIRPNETDPYGSGSGSTTLHYILINCKKTPFTSMIIFLDNSDVPIGEKGTESFSWLSSEFAKRMLYDQFSRFTLVYVLKWIHCFHYMICYTLNIVLFHYTFATVLNYIYLDS